MSWEKFIEINNIGKIFHNVDIEQVIFNKPLHSKILRNFILKPMSLILFGPPGRGKTYTTLALIRELLKKENPYSIRFIKAKSIDDIVMQKLQENLSSSCFVRSLCEGKYLAIDDFGIDKATPRVVTDLYEIIDYRWSNELPTIISTNLKEDEIISFYGERIGSRLNSYKKLFFGGKDLRNI